VDVHHDDKAEIFDQLRIKLRFHAERRLVKPRAEATQLTVMTEDTCYRILCGGEELASSPARTPHRLPTLRPLHENLSLRRQTCPENDR
jgi:hypothetical protein